MTWFSPNRVSPAERLYRLCGKEPLPMPADLRWRKTSRERFCGGSILQPGTLVELCGAPQTGKTHLGLSVARTLLSRNFSCLIIDQDHGARSWLVGPFRNLIRQGLVVLLPRSPKETHEMVVHAIWCGGFDLVLLDSLGFVCEPDFQRDSVHRWLQTSSTSRTSFWVINPMSPFGGLQPNEPPPQWYPCSGHPGARDLGAKSHSRIWVEAPGVLWVREPELSL